MEPGADYHVVGSVLIAHLELDEPKLEEFENNGRTECVSVGAWFTWFIIVGGP